MISLKKKHRYMRSAFRISFVLCLFLFIPVFLNAQMENLASFKPQEGVRYELEKNDGTVFVGEIIKYDPREVLIRTMDKGDMIIPKHEVKSISRPESVEFNPEGVYISEDRFSTRYFLTTNGLPIRKGEHYGQFNVYGPELHFAVADNLGLGVMTSWIFTPMLGTIKYSVKLGDKSSLALGGLGGFIGWLQFDHGIALPYMTLTFGDRRSNLSFTGGYGAYFNDGITQGRPLFSVAALHKFGERYSLVLDSFLAPKDENGFGIVTLGARYQSSPRSALQFGLATIWVEDYIVPLPIPMGSLFFRL
jgi:hypothetical protein